MLWQRAEENVVVAASHIDLAAAEVELAGVVGREVILRDKLAECADEFDYVLIDCPPSLGILTINALAAVDDVFLPLQPHFLALHGLSKLLKTIGLVNERLNDRLQLAGVVLCLYESGTKLAAEVSRDVEQFFREARKGGRAWSARATVRNAHPPQHPPGRGPQLRPIDLPIRRHFARRRRLPRARRRSAGLLRRAIGAGTNGRVRTSVPAEPSQRFAMLALADPLPHRMNRIRSGRRAHSRFATSRPQLRL